MISSASCRALALHLVLLLSTQLLTCLPALGAEKAKKGKDQAVRMDLALFYGIDMQFNPVFWLISEGHEAGVGDLGRISGGKIPSEGKYPSLARLVRIEKDGRLSHAGSATILNRDWILTSASRFGFRNQMIRNISRLRVVVGDSILNETEPYEQMVAIERVIIHEAFDSFKYSLYKIHVTQLSR